MMTNRRQFLGSGAAAMVLAAGRVPAAQAADETPQCLDYGRSFICGTASFNAVRFWIESRTTLIDQATGESVEFYQCASCKSENTFAEKNLFHADNYDFLPILGGGEWLIFRRRARLSPDYRTVRSVKDMWGPPLVKTRLAKADVLESWEQIRDATAAGRPLVTQTTLTNSETGLRAVIECPTKTMNVNLDHRKYQVDTGPIAFPDLTQRHDPEINGLSLAFIAFNAPDFADFIVEQPTPVVEADVEKCQVYHYSAPFSLPATNRVLALRADPE